MLTKEPHEVQEDQKQDRASGAEEAGALTGRAAALQKSAWGSRWPQAEREPAVCPCTGKGQPYPGLC